MHKSPPPGRRKKPNVLVVTDRLVPARPTGPAGPSGPRRPRGRPRRRRKPNWNKKTKSKRKIKEKDPFKRGKIAENPTLDHNGGVDVAVRKPIPDHEDAAGDQEGNGPPQKAEERLFLSWLFGR